MAIFAPKMPHTFAVKAIVTSPPRAQAVNEFCQAMAWIFSSHGMHACHLLISIVQGCQMVNSKIKNPNLGKFWRDLPRLENVDTFYGHLQYFTDI
jgi:hypothetical protein